MLCINTNMDSMSMSAGTAAQYFCPVRQVGRITAPSDAVTLPVPSSAKNVSARASIAMCSFLRFGRASASVVSRVRNWLHGRIRPQSILNEQNNPVLCVQRDSLYKRHSNYAVHAVAVSSLAIETVSEQVYNLQVERFPEYFANGILVHNCLFGNPGVHDDIVDTMSGAHFALTNGRAPGVLRV